MADCTICLELTKEAMDNDNGLTLEEEDAEQEQLWEKIESKRHILTRSINPSKLTAYLRQCKIIDEEDEDEVLRSHLLISRRARASRLLDILRSRGNRGYEAFLESLELYYAELYKLITGKEPTRCCSVLVEEGYEGLTQFLMNEAVKVQKQLKDKDLEIHKLYGKCEALQESNKQLNHHNQELRSYQERYSKLKEEFNIYNNELNKVKEDSYLLAMRYAQLNEEKNLVVMKSRDLQLENDQMKCRLHSIEEECLMARKLSSKLKKDIENMPSKQSINKLQLDKEQLQTTIQELQQVVKVTNSLPSTEKVLLDIMDHDRKEALEDRQELVERFHKTNMELQQAEELRDKYLREKEELGLQLSRILKECQMHKRRVGTILKQLEEVEKERDQALKVRDEAQTAYAQIMLDNSRYRRQIWAVEEKLDSLQMELTKREGEIAALQSQLHQLKESNCSVVDLDFCGSLSSHLNFIGCPEDWNSEDQEQDTFPIFSRQDCVKKMKSSSIQSGELPESEFGEELSPTELLWTDIEYEREMNRFSMIPFPPCKESLMRRVKQEESASGFEIWSTDNEDNSPDEGQILSLSLTADLARPSFHPESEDTSLASNNSRTLSPSLSLPDLTSINISVKHDHNDITTIGGSENALLVKSVQQGSEVEKVGLQLEEGTSQKILLQNGTEKDAHWALDMCSLAGSLQLQKNEAGYRKLERVFEDEEPMVQDSFYIRVNLNILGQVDSCSLQVKCDEILHVLDTIYQTKCEWLCARVDPFTMKDLEQGIIPSYSRAHQLLLLKIYALTGNVWKNEREKKFMKMRKLCPDQVRIVPAKLPRHLPSANSPSPRCWHEDKDEKIVPYSLVQPITVQQKRPVIIMPTLLAKALMQRLLQLPSASEFSVVQPEIVTEEQLKTKTRYSLHKIMNQDKYECITLESIRDVIAKDKHGLLPIGVHSAKDLITEKIYTIIIHIKVTTKNIKKLRKLAPKSCSSDNEFLKLHRIEQKHLESVPCLSATVEPNMWSSIEELIKAVKENIFQEQKKIVWIEQNKLSQGCESSSAILHSRPNI
ncbi:caspase recruitment domain-containing protein 11-like isoform X2 [Heterodontus francisci]|uniref:caspase recruitment domain-containing protein 11-like isoform X2 n=1 Tax=Heterodontus francisci TaxID=7792 RepID=UPI00355B60B4